MAVISFRFTADTDRGQQARMLGHLGKMTGVRAVGRIDPGSADALVSRMCYAESVDAAHVPDIVAELHKAAGVEGVAVESRRGLAS